MAKGVIASRLKELRESLKLSQAKVASLNGTATQASINRYENQQSDPSLDILLFKWEKILHYLLSFFVETIALL